MPLKVEKQVLSIYVATSGLMDSVPVNEVRRFEKELLQFVETSQSSILTNISEKKALDDGDQGGNQESGGSVQAAVFGCGAEAAAAK